MLQTALAAEEAARGKPGTATVDEDMGGKPGAAGGSSRLSGGGGGLSAAERGSVVEAVLEDEEYQLGLVHACIEASHLLRISTHWHLKGTFWAIQRAVRRYERICARWRCMLARLPLWSPVQVVNFAYLRSPAEAFPWAALQLRRMHHSVELWQVSKHHAKASTAPARVCNRGALMVVKHNGAVWVLHQTGKQCVTVTPMPYNDGRVSIGWWMGLLMHPWALRALCQVGRGASAS